MISINLSLDQLVDAVNNLTQAERNKLSKVLNNGDMALSEEQKQIVLQRQKAYRLGDMEAYSLDELKSVLKYTEEFDINS